ncbi:Reverse transcriptase domain-containing protein [Aphis craccivora]|uniref:Reverse transcriptase domain-containing protein n=1 Tax=Aphis craccivora TaxID=307492 RepID=A0A6G0ZG69_APHCR|nr:Reverse transcriptase domain-containing protein [Aphis craccivora]
MITNRVGKFTLDRFVMRTSPQHFFLVPILIINVQQNCTINISRMTILVINYVLLVVFVTDLVSRRTSSRLVAGFSTGLQPARLPPPLTSPTMTVSLSGGCEYTLQNISKMRNCPTKMVKINNSEEQMTTGDENSKLHYVMGVWILNNDNWIFNIKYRENIAGDSQGGIVSPFIFNIYTSDQQLTCQNTVVGDYVDDKFIIMSFDNNLLTAF